MLSGIAKIILAAFLYGFIYHICSILIHLIPYFESWFWIHFTAAIISLILFILCYVFSYKKCKTCDENHHNINKIR